MSSSTREKITPERSKYSQHEYKTLHCVVGREWNEWTGGVHLGYIWHTFGVHLGKVHLRCIFQYIFVHFSTSSSEKKPSILGNRDVHLGYISSTSGVHLHTFGDQIHLHTSERKCANYIYVHLQNQMYSDVTWRENPGKWNVHPGYIWGTSEVHLRYIRDVRKCEYN